MVVKEYQEGKLGYNLLAQKHGIKGSTPIKEWVENMRNLERKRRTTMSDKARELEKVKKLRKKKK